LFSLAFVCKRPGSKANNIKYTIIIQNLPHPKRTDIREVGMELWLREKKKPDNYLILVRSRHARLCWLDK